MPSVGEEKVAIEHRGLAQRGQKNLGLLPGFLYGPSRRHGAQTIHLVYV